MKLARPVPRVSVVIPTWNRSDYLKEAVESVRVQTYPDWELFIVNDGSTDDTRRVVGQLMQKDPRIRGIHQQNRGISAARNAGVRHSRSPFLAFLDDDDAWLPQKLERLVPMLESDPRLGLVFSQVYMTNEFLEPYEIYPSQWFPNFEGVLKRQCWISISSVLCRRDALEEAGPFDESLLWSEDYDFFLRLARCFSVSGLQEPLVLYRKHGGGKSCQREGRHLAHLVTWRKMLSYPESRAFACYIWNQIALEQYELARGYRNSGAFFRAAKHFIQSAFASPAIGLQFQRYDPRRRFFGNLLKPYAAAGDCLLKGLLRAAR